MNEIQKEEIKMSVFGVLMIAWGAYTLAQMNLMKKSGVIPKGIMVGKKATIPANADTAGFIKDMYMKGIIVGCLGCIMGIADMAKEIYSLPQIVSTIVYVVFFASLVVFGICLKKAQKKFLHM